MKSPLYRDILAATDLTRAGNLVRATRLLQNTLRGVGAPATSTGHSTNPDFRNLERTHLCVASGSSKNGTGGRFRAKSFSSADGSRAYKLYVPSQYNGQPCPLIVMLHGCTQSPDDFAAGTRMNELAEEQTFLVAYPEQSTSANALRCWNWFNAGNQQRDRGEPSLIAGITHQIMQEHVVDRERVYVAGMSAGAAAAAILGATYPDVYAAIGVHSGLTCGLAHDLPTAFAAMKSGNSQSPEILLGQRTAESDRPIPTIVFHGDRDSTVHPRNGERFAASMATVHCVKRIEKGQVPGGRDYTQTTYTDMDGRRMLEQWVIHGASHAWSGGSVSGSYTDPQGPDASLEMVRFFLAHRTRASNRCSAEMNDTEK